MGVTRASTPSSATTARSRPARLCTRAQAVGTSTSPIQEASSATTPDAGSVPASTFVATVATSLPRPVATRAAAPIDGPLGTETSRSRPAGSSTDSANPCTPLVRPCRAPPDHPHLAASPPGPERPSNGSSPRCPPHRRDLAIAPLTDRPSPSVRSSAAVLSTPTKSNTSSSAEPPRSALASGRREPRSAPASPPARAGPDCQPTRRSTSAPSPFQARPRPLACEHQPPRLRSLTFPAPDDARLHLGRQEFPDTRLIAAVSFGSCPVVAHLEPLPPTSTPTPSSNES